MNVKAAFALRLLVWLKLSAKFTAPVKNLAGKTPAQLLAKAVFVMEKALKIV